VTTLNKVVTGGHQDRLLFLVPSVEDAIERSVGQDIAGDTRQQQFELIFPATFSVFRGRVVIDLVDGVEII